MSVRVRCLLSPTYIWVHASRYLSLSLSLSLTHTHTHTHTRACNSALTFTQPGQPPTLFELLRAADTTTQAADPAACDARLEPDARGGLKSRALPGGTTPPVFSLSQQLAKQVCVCGGGGGGCATL